MYSLILPIIGDSWATVVSVDCLPTKSVLWLVKYSNDLMFQMHWCCWRSRMNPWVSMPAVIICDQLLWFVDASCCWNVVYKYCWASPICLQHVNNWQMPDQPAFTLPTQKINGRLLANYRNVTTYGFNLPFISSRQNQNQKQKSISVVSLFLACPAHLTASLELMIKDRAPWKMANVSSGISLFVSDTVAPS